MRRGLEEPEPRHVTVDVEVTARLNAPAVDVPLLESRIQDVLDWFDSDGDVAIAVYPWEEL